MRSQFVAEVLRTLHHCPHPPHRDVRAEDALDPRHLCHLPRVDREHPLEDPLLQVEPPPVGGQGLDQVAQRVVDVRGALDRLDDADRDGRIDDARLTVGSGAGASAWPACLRRRAFHAASARAVAYWTDSDHAVPTSAGATRKKAPYKAVALRERVRRDLSAAAAASRGVPSCICSAIAADGTSTCAWRSRPLNIALRPCTSSRRPDADGVAHDAYSTAMPSGAAGERSSAVHTDANEPIASIASSARHARSARSPTLRAAPSTGIGRKTP